MVRVNSSAILLAATSLMLAGCQSSTPSPVIDSDGYYDAGQSDEGGSAQAYPVDQSAPVSSSPESGIAPAGGVTTAAGSAESFNRSQRLEQEVAELRGKVEELNHQLEQLKQQRLDDYKNLDARLSAGGGAAAGMAGSVASSPESAAPEGGFDAGAMPVDSAPSDGASSGGDEQSDYAAATQLVKERRHDDAITAFRRFVSQYPSSTRAPNAYYWLGELYAVKGGYEQARNAYARVLEMYPTHERVPNSMFKVGKVYHLMGQDAKARQWLERVQSQYPGSKPAEEAAKYLRTEM